MDDTAQAAEQLASSLEPDQTPRWLPPRSVNNWAQNDTLARKCAKKRAGRGAIATTPALSRSHSSGPDRHATVFARTWLLGRSIQRGCHFGSREAACSRASDHHNLRSTGPLRASMSKPLSNTAFYAIASDGVAHPLADRDSQSVLALVRASRGAGSLRGRHDDKTARNPTPPGFDHAPEILCAQDAVRPPEAARFGNHRPTSRGCWLRGACGPSPGGASESRVLRVFSFVREIHALVSGGYD